MSPRYSTLLIIAVVAAFLAVSVISISAPLENLSIRPFSAGFTADPVLENKLKALIADFHGDIGVYVRHLGRKSETGINHHNTFPTASIVKIPILIGIHQQIAAQTISLDQQMTYHDSQAYPGSGIMQFFKDKTQVELKTLVFLMIAFSDNVASLWNQELAGGGATINSIMQSLKLNVTRVNSRTPGREDEWKRWGWGQSTPYEMANLVALIREGKVLDQELSKQMYRFLGNHYYDGRSLSQISPFIKTGSKSGSIDASRSEVVFVNNPAGEYVFSVFTNNNQDQSWDDSNEAEELTRKIAKMLTDYYVNG